MGATSRRRVFEAIGLGALLITWSACNRPAATPTVPTAKAIPKEQRLAAAKADVTPVISAPPPKAASALDEEIGRRATTVKEVALMLRGGYSQGSIIAIITKRHIAEPLTPPEEASLITAGAGPELLQALKDPQNILTPLQRTAYAQKATRKNPRPTLSTNAQR